MITGQFNALIVFFYPDERLTVIYFFPKWLCGFLGGFSDLPFFFFSWFFGWVFKNFGLICFYSTVVDCSPCRVNFEVGALISISVYLSFYSLSYSFVFFLCVNFKSFSGHYLNVCNCCRCYFVISSVCFSLLRCSILFGGVFVRYAAVLPLPSTDRIITHVFATTFASSSSKTKPKGFSRNMNYSKRLAWRQMGAILTTIMAASFNPPAMKQPVCDFRTKFLSNSCKLLFEFSVSLAAGWFLFDAVGSFWQTFDRGFSDFHRMLFNSPSVSDEMKWNSLSFLHFLTSSGAVADLFHPHNFSPTSSSLKSVKRKSTTATTKKKDNDKEMERNPNCFEAQYLILIVFSVRPFLLIYSIILRYSYNKNTACLLNLTAMACHELFSIISIASFLFNLLTPVPPRPPLILMSLKLHTRDNSYTQTHTFSMTITI